MNNAGTGVTVANPGVDVHDFPRSPQRFNPKILQMELLLLQRPGIYPHIVMWKQAHYDKINAEYEQVEVFFGSAVVASIPVVGVH